ncbi:hypothetical protein [Leptolyngbya sp. GGD]|uniref:hypothetical protein n=1 Tax=Leptolyngbya sp. GGD TaxID=2997907 RepID=UPI00227CFCB6|nr:hypothetical protein [Leptolyngbya sp. GGD]MCY6491914.1 hypothetical protein [Leptolyngbya sp. GGD]
MTRFLIPFIALVAIIQGCQPISHQPKTEPIKGFEVPADRPAIEPTNRIQNNTIRPDEVEQIEQRRAK